MADRSPADARPTTGELAIKIEAVEEMADYKVSHLEEALAGYTKSVNALSKMTAEMGVQLGSVSQTVKSWRRAIWLLVSAATTSIFGQIALDLWVFHRGGRP